MKQINEGILSINAVVGKIMSESQACGCSNMVVPLGEFRDRLLEANRMGQDLSRSGFPAVQDDRSWRMWTQTLPPIAFEIARETKELVQRVGGLTPASKADEFS